jgi:hypothetical protein
VEFAETSELQFVAVSRTCSLVATCVDSSVQFHCHHPLAVSMPALPLEAALLGRSFAYPTALALPSILFCRAACQSYRPPPEFSLTQGFRFSPTRLRGRTHKARELDKELGTRRASSTQAWMARVHTTGIIVYGKILGKQCKSSTYYISLFYVITLQIIDPICTEYSVNIDAICRWPASQSCVLT